MEDLPHDIVFNIFSRLPAKSLIRFRCVSQPWCSIIDDPSLAYMHLSLAIEEPGLLLLAHPRVDETSFYSVKEDRGKIKANYNAIAQLAISHKYTLEGSCNGLLCFYRLGDTGRIFVCNPLKREVISPPPITTRTPVPIRHKFGLGFNPSTKEYKVVRVSISFNFSEDNISLGAEIYTLGTKSWREIINVPRYPIHGKPIFANGALHWKIDTDLVPYKTEDLIISFNLMKEEFQVTTHPEFILERNGLIDLIELRGYLAVVDLSFNTHIEIWVLKDYEKKQWVREYRISLKAPEGRSDNRHAKVIGLWEHGEILLTLNGDAFFSYDPKTDGLRYVHILGLDPDTTISDICSHTGSLVSLKAYDSTEKAA